MEWTVGRIAEESSVSGKALAAGDRVWSYLFLDSEGAVQRMDVLAEEAESVERPRQLLCCWQSTVKGRETSGAAERQAALESAEASFLALFEEAEGGESGAAEDVAGEELAESMRAARERLTFILALQLERKRILRPLGKGRYLHVASKREFTVPQPELTAELIRGLREDVREGNA